MLRLTTLGAMDLRDRHGHPLRDVLAQPKRVALLTFLAVEGSSGPVSRDRLLAAFWPESDEARARNALSQALHHLRQALGPGLIESQGPHRLGVDGARLWCDATVFVEAVERGDVELALDLYRGEFCPGLYVSGSPDLEHWLDEQRRRLRGRAFAALRTAAERMAARGDGEAAARAARRALAMHPDDEADVRALLQCLERSGDVAGALLAYREYEKRLADDLDTKPAPETRQLVEEMRRGRDAAPADAAQARSVAAPSPAPPSSTAAGTEPVPPSVRPPRRGTRRTAILAGLAGVAAVVAIIVWRQQEERATPMDDNAVATFPFAVTGDPALAYLADGMVDLLDARLDGAGGLRTIDPHAIQAAVARGPRSAALDPAVGSQLSRQLGARLFILGDVVASRGRVHLGATLYDGVHDRPVSHATVDGDAGQLFPLVDALAGQLLASRPEGPDTRLTRVAALTTKSLDALRAYVTGERAYRAGRYQEAAEAFERATALDTSFALAWYRLAVARDWAGGDARDAVAHAFAHAAELAPRERQLVGTYWLYLGLSPATERAYHVAVTDHPDDVEAWSFLGETQFHLIVRQGRSFTESREAFTKVLELDPGNPNALLHLARVAAAEGRNAEVDSLARLFLVRYPDADRSLEMRVLRAFALGDRAEQGRLSAEVARTRDVTLDVAARGVAAYVQDLDGAARLVPILVAPTRTTFYSARGRALDAELALAAGRWGDAQRRLTALAAEERDFALELRALLATEPLTPASPAELIAVRGELLHWRPGAFTPGAGTNFTLQNAHWQPQLCAYLLGLVSVRLGDTAAARGYAQTLDRLDGTAGDSGLAGDYAHTVRAEIAKQAGAWRQALAQAEQIHFTFQAPVMRSTLYAGAHERFLHAELLHAVGRDEEAARWYASFPEPAGYDITYLAPAYLRRGEIAERLGHRAEAIAFYRRAAALWKDCDPALRPMLAEAQHAVQRLSSGS
jgi:DNA-binding SARP family transcriptional activator/Tfp pilus assembly protein PilF/TolB-like protein